MFGDWNNQESVLKATNYCNEWRERCLAERKSHIFETVMSASDKVDYILRAKEAGFYAYDNSIEDAEARLLFRLNDGELVKRYVEELPNWASTILPR